MTLPTLQEATRVWWKVGIHSFGGPAGQIAVMHRVLVDEHRWISEHRFLHALNYCMLLPGPEAQQLATYLGWLMHGTKGGLIAGTLFVLPGAAAMLLLSILYVSARDWSFVDGFLFGLKTAVLALVLEAVIRIGKRVLKNFVMFAIAAAAFLAIFLWKVPFPWIVLSAGLIGLIGGTIRKDLFHVIQSKAAPSAKGTPVVDALLDDEIPEHVRPSMGRAVRTLVVCLVLWFTPVLLARAWLGADHVVVVEGVFFSKAAVVTFGGAYAVLAYVEQQAVGALQWISGAEMIDGLGLAETTPGPLILVLQFVGFLAGYHHPGELSPMVAAVLGALMMLWVTFVPCFLWIFLGAPYIETTRRSSLFQGALSAITASVVGVILNLAVRFGMRVLFHGSTAELHVRQLDPLACVLSAGALLLLLRFKRGMIPTILACALAGLVLRR